MCSVPVYLFLCAFTFSLLASSVFVNPFFVGCCMSATLIDLHPGDPKQTPPNDRLCARTDRHCPSCPILLANSSYLHLSEIRRVGCCGQTRCHIVHPTLAATLQLIPNLPQCPPTSSNRRFRYYAYRHLVCHNGFGRANPNDGRRVFLSCCILHRVRCTWPSGTGGYTGHVETNGYVPAYPI